MDKSLLSSSGGSCGICRCPCRRPQNRAVEVLPFLFWCVVEQILYLYGTNKKAEVPCLVTLSGMGPLISTAIKRLSGFDAWVGVTKETRCYTELFEKGGLTG